MIEGITSFLPADMHVRNDQDADPYPDAKTSTQNNNIWTDEMREKLLRLRCQDVPITQVIAQVR